jgi:hypothetical protein
VAPIQPDAEPGKGTSQCVNVRSRQRRSFRRGRFDLVHGAPVGSVATSVDIPLRILPAFAVATIEVVHLGQRLGGGGDRACAANSLVRPVGRRVRAGLAATAELPNPAHQALQQFSGDPSAANGAGERIHHVVVGLVVVEFGQGVP